MSTATPSQDAWQVFQRFERNGWNDVATVYAELVDALRLTNGPAGTAILDAAHVGSGQRVADVATGPGFLAKLATDRGADVIGIDIAPAMVSEARRRHPQLTFEVAAAEGLPIDTATLDAVVSAWGLPHFANHRRVFAEAQRVLRPGGRLALATWRPPPGNQFFAIVLGALAPHLHHQPELPPGPDMFRYAEDTKAHADLGAAGFTNIQCRAIAFDGDLPNGAHDLVRFLSSGSVRSQALYRAQPPEARARIDAEVHAALSRLDTGGGRPRIRLEAVVISAAKPPA